MNKTIRYKLTNKDHQTMNNTQWGENITHETNGEGDLCSSGWLHCYSDPILALLLNPIHANIEDPILWECEVAGETKGDRGLKEGWTKMTTTKIIEQPEITIVNRIAFGILCALEVCKEDSFVKWATSWLDGSDRSRESASAYSYAAADYAAVRAAADAAYAAYADLAVLAVLAAYYAAYYAADAKLPFDVIIKKAMAVK